MRSPGGSRESEGSEPKLLIHQAVPDRIHCINQRGTMKRSGIPEFRSSHLMPYSVGQSFRNPSLVLEAAGRQGGMAKNQVDLGCVRTGNLDRAHQR